MSVIATLRIQTLTRQINKANLQMMLLTQQQQTMSSVVAESGRQYQQLYAKINGVYGTITAQQQDLFTSKLEQLEAVYIPLSEKDNEIDMEIAALETQIKAYTEELKNVEKFQESQAKKEAPKLTLG